MAQAHLELGIPTASVALARDFQGFKQYREGEGDRWRFYVASFDATVDGQDGYCWVLREDGSNEMVPIDSHGRIRIGGKRYGREDWDH
ncbi:hypothetical protein ACU4GI_33460 [Cupriavidus basilensis]